MSLAVVHSRARVGVEAPPVTVEVHLSNGLPALSMVGLPETAVRESRERVRSALLASGFEFPTRRITVNLAPADLPKQGGRYDLAIAVGILAASSQIPQQRLEGHEFVAELALGGATRPVDGLLPSVLAAGRADRCTLCAPGNAAEAALAGPGRVRLADHLRAVCQYLRGLEELPQPQPLPEAAPEAREEGVQDLARVRGQVQARRALEIAAAGGHNLLLTGPPGTGKTLLAACLPGLLPPMSVAEALEVAAVRSVRGLPLEPRYWRQRPFRSPHHSASAVALTGGGPAPLPGEVSLAHQGVLFMDELPEFPRHALDMLREPLESGHIHIARAAGQCRFPARFQLIAAMNPCPCGYLGDPERACRCTPAQIARYQGRVSGPLLDRIDLQVRMPRMPWRELERTGAGESSARVRARVLAARERQQARGGINAGLDPARVETLCGLDATGRRILERVARHFQLSPRALHRLLRVARTIADLAGENNIGAEHVQEAASFRLEQT
ncbi:MAG TPA: ATP-dependent protease [Gammaproteobacteria bacterium]|nr:ATP-dependent protease [Gammaproteobacteria bacterium]